MKKIFFFAFCFVFAFSFVLSASAAELTLDLTPGRYLYTPRALDNPSSVTISASGSIVDGDAFDSILVDYDGSTSFLSGGAEVFLASSSDAPFYVLIDSSDVILSSDSEDIPSDFFDSLFSEAFFDNSFLSALTRVFSTIGTWIVASLGSLIGLFYAQGSLTFFGLLAIVALGISIFFLLVRVLQNFLHFRS